MRRRKHDGIAKPKHSMVQFEMSNFVKRRASRSKASLSPHLAHWGHLGVDDYFLNIHISQIKTWDKAK